MRLAIACACICGASVGLVMTHSVSGALVGAVLGLPVGIVLGLVVDAAGSLCLYLAGDDGNPSSTRLVYAVTSAAAVVIVLIGIAAATNMLSEAGWVITACAAFMFVVGLLRPPVRVKGVRKSHFR